ncbi:hypothetical protein ACUNV4_09200 [Granulosicoccus sp. 3-233]|uniref:hypothetical protein n=1 Tax=Granulosicoccus sp. 3-233 TaxID=3417969 RepID=UPI003D32F971
MTIQDTDLDDTATRTPGVQDVITVLLERALATADVTTATLKLAIAEARLAMSSAGLLVALLVILVVMIPITWLVALATAYAALLSAGLGSLSSFAILLGLQIVICTALVLIMLKLSRLMAFRRTRQALQTSLGKTGDNRIQPTEAENHVTNSHQA